MSEPSVVIVGAGLAGLAAGVLFARRGVRVRIFEAGGKTAGSSGHTRIDGYTFHDGAIYLGGKGLLDSAFARLGLDRQTLLPLRAIASPLTAYLPDGSAVTITKGDVRLTRNGAAIACGTEVDRVLARWRPLARLISEDVAPHPPSAWRVLRSWRHLHKLRGIAADELRRTFADEAVRSGLAGALLFAGTPPDRLPVTLVLAPVSMLDDGLHMPAGGMGSIPEVLAEALAESGGELHHHVPVRRIVVEHGRARGLELEGHEPVVADAVLCTATGMATFGRLVAPAPISWTPPM